MGAAKPKNKNNLLWRIHHWAGLYAGILIAVLSVTGAAAVFIPEIDLLIQKKVYQASSTPSETINFEKSLQKLKVKYPGLSSLTVDVPEKPGQALGLNFIVKGETKADTKRYYYFIDAGKDEIVGARDQQQNSLANYLRQIHVRLYDGIWGRQLVGLGGIALLVIAITGLLIYSDFMKRQPYPKVRSGKGLRIVLADWHKLLGISALAFNLVIAATGAWLGLQPKLMNWFNIETPNTFKAPVNMDETADQEYPVNWAEVMAAAKKEFPALKPTYLSSSENGSATVIVNGNIKGQVYERGINKLVLSKTDLKPVYKFDVREATFGQKFYCVQEALHFGDYGGLGVKIIYTLLGLTSGFLSISGFVIFLYRTDKKVERKFNPLKLTFIYSIITLLVLAAIAAVSMFVGYTQASAIVEILLNAGLVMLIIWLLIKPYIKPKLFKRLSTT